MQVKHEPRRVVAQEVKKAVSALEHAVQASPWALTENYVSAVLEKRGHLALVGAGDPSGRGRAFSYTKDPRRVRSESPNDVGNE